MTQPQVGVTHDAVLHVNHSVAVGLMIAPATLRVRQAPTFVPSLAVGAPSGVDLSRWKAFVQARFDGGAGQVYLSAEDGNNRYAESNFIDIGLPVSVIGGQSGRDDPLTAASVPGGPLDDDPVGDIQSALRPLGTTAETPLATLFTNARSVHVFMVSNNPYLFHWKSAFVYTNITAPNVWGGTLLQTTRNALKGKWVAMDTQMDGNIWDVCRWSNAFAIAVGNKGIRLFHPDSGITEPSYSTRARVVHVYDRKLWVAHDFSGNIGYYDPSSGDFSTPVVVGTHDSRVMSMCTFAGRLYIGKRDSLWVFEGGRMYEIENFGDFADNWNFSLMVVHRGAMYFNIGQRVYRLTASNMIELLQIPVINGVITGGASIAGELYMAAREPEGNGRIFVFNTETGGTRQWFRTEDIAVDIAGVERAPSNLQGAGGYVWMAPMYLSTSYSTLGISCPITAVNKMLPSLGATIPRYARTHSYLITSMFDMGLPEVEKEFDRVIVDYTLYSPGDRIDVSYTTALKAAKFLAVKGIGIANEGALNDGMVGVDAIDAAFTPAGTDFYIGFQERPKYVRFIFNEADTEAITWTLKYRTPGGWVFVDYIDGTEYFTKDGFWTLGDTPNWSKLVVGGVEAYWLLMEPTSSGQVVIQEIDGISSLERQDWTLLGSITSQDDVRQEISFPRNTLAYQMMLKFDFFATDTTRPDMRRFTLKYMNVGKPYISMSFQVVAVEPIETLQLAKEMSAGFIQASLFSCASHGKTYVVGVPYPFPQGHTRRFKVSIGEPGAMVPMLAYQHSGIGALVPVTLDEM